MFDEIANLTFTNQHFQGCESGSGSLVGGYTRRVIPVPIPNTVVKPAGPMILHQRESRSLPAFNKEPRGLN